MARTLLFGLIILGLGCGAPEKTYEKQIFRYNEAKNVTSMDPAFAKYKANIWVVNQVYNGLVQLNDKLQIMPCLAKRWEISEDGLTYTFYLREDVLFHPHESFPGGKGRRMVATDVVYSLQRLIDTELASPGAWIFNDRVDTLEPFSAPEQFVFKMKLLKPFRPMLGILSMQYCSVVPREVVKRYGKDFRRHPIGTGPFLLKKWEEDRVMYLLKNEQYFEHGENEVLPYLDGVRITFVQEKNMEFLEFLNGELDFVDGIDGKTVKDDILTKEGELLPKLRDKVHLDKAPYLNTEFIGFLVDSNQEATQGSPVLKKKFRQAVNYAIDRQRMIIFLRNNIGQAAHSGFIPAGLPAFNPEEVQGYRYDPGKARILLQEIGYDDKGPSLTLVSSISNRDICTFVQKQLKEVGISCKVETLQPGTLLEMTSTSTAPFFRGNWIADYPDAETFLVVFYGQNPAPPNYTRFNNKEFDRLYEQALSELDEDKRMKLYRDMDRILIREAPVVFLYYDQILHFTQNYVSGLGQHPMNVLDLKHVKFNKKSPSGS